MEICNPRILGSNSALIWRSVGHCELTFASCELTNFMRESIGAK